MAGPVLSYRTKSKITPFAHVLFGVDRTRLGASTLSGVSSPVSTTATTDTDLAVALGGGVDYKIFRHVALRVGQLDYYHTSLDMTKFYQSAFGVGLLQGLATHQGNLRFSAGAVLRF